MNRQCSYERKSLIITTLSIFLSASIFLVCGGYLMFDEFEHLRASYLVSFGFHPYKDFFEHHHPILWYIWAPLLKYLPHDQILLFYLSRILTTLFSLIGVYYIYQTAKRFLGGKEIAVYALVIYFSFYFVQSMAIVFKPDAYMWCFYLCGLYHFFCFIETKETKPLIITASSFSIAFTFLQTAVFLILSIAIVSIYILYKEKYLIKKYLIASIPAIIILVAFFTFIHLTSGIIPYYQANWVLNYHQHDFVTYSYLYLPKFLPFILIGYMAYGYQIKQRQATIYTHIIALFFTINLIKNILYLTPFAHYFQAEALAVSFLLAPITPKLSRPAKTYLISILITLNVMNIRTSLCILSNKPYFKQLEIIAKDKNSLVYPPVFYIYTPHFPFYGLFPSLAASHDHLFHKTPEFNATKYVNDHKIDYILDDIGISISKPSKKVYTNYTQYLIDSTILKLYYESISKDKLEIYKRKPDL